MNDYCNGKAYSTGFFVTENNKTYLFVRNLDKWYIENITILTVFLWILGTRKTSQTPHTSVFRNKAKIYRQKNIFKILYPYP